MGQVFHALAAQADIRRMTRAVIANNGLALRITLRVTFKSGCCGWRNFRVSGAKALNWVPASLQGRSDGPTRRFFRIYDRDIEVVRIVDGKRRITRKLVSGEDERRGRVSGGIVRQASKRRRD
jgi:hypothetical protein